MKRTRRSSSPRTQLVSLALCFSLIATAVMPLSTAGATESHPLASAFGLKPQSGFWSFPARALGSFLTLLQGGGPPSVPGPNLPDLDIARQTQAAEPSAPAEAIKPGEPGVCRDCDPVNLRPVAVIGGPYTGSVLQPIAFRGNQSFDPEGDELTFQWNFGDGGNASNATPQHSYSTPGNKTVTLIVTDSEGLSSFPVTTTFNVSAAPTPTPTATPTPTPAPGTNNASFVSQSVPTPMSAGQLYSVSVTMKNIGSRTWTAAHLYRLGSQSVQDNSIWGMSRVYLQSDVLPGADAVFSFTVVAPPGAPYRRGGGGTHYNFQWRMVQDGVEWFGEPSPASDIVSVGNMLPIHVYTPQNHYMARLEPRNRTGQAGEDLLSRNFSWGTSILGLAGRAGLDLGLSLSYNSLVWTRVSSSMIFDADHGFPSPGFRLGFPTIQAQFFNNQANANSYLMITPAGGRVELRQTKPGVYESVDSSHLQLTEGDGDSLLLNDTSGARMTYALINGEFRCTSIKDRNGNYITIKYDPINAVANPGRMTSIIDTLGRTINFEYDGSLRLRTITQAWNGESRPWATFAYEARVVQTNFVEESGNGDTSVLGLPEDNTINVLKQVGLADGSRYKFSYTPWGQVYKITHYAADSPNDDDHHPLSYVSYSLPLNNIAQADCPRFTERRNWAENWNGNSEAVTSYSYNPEAITTTGTVWEAVEWSQMELPDGTKYREYSTAAYDFWDRGLVTRSDTYAAGDPAPRKTTLTDLTQDRTDVGYPLNPRTTGVTISDSDGNRRRTTIDYASFGLPSDVFEWGPAGAGWSLLRRTHTDYELSAAYVNQRIIGLAKQQFLFGAEDSGQRLYSKMSYEYDAGEEFLQNQGNPVQHDANYGTTAVARGNVTKALRWDVSYETDITHATASTVGYNTSGSIVFTRDPLGHSGRQTTISYTDAFSSNGTDATTSAGLTLAYPTTVTDPDGFSSTAKYNYDLGAVTRQQDPKGAAQTTEYDSAGRVKRVTNAVNLAYTRFVYPTSQTIINRFTTIKDLATETYTATVFDGAGRMRAVAGDFPNSTGHYSGQFTLYDRMGRAIQQTNPTEMTNQWAAAGDDLAGWHSSSQTYDWKGRPLVTTNQDGTTKVASYGGCGCAGGAIVTLTDEGTMDGGVLKRRQQKVYADALGRTVKTELLNWQGGSVYSTIVNTLNARDQVTLVRQYSGAEGSGTYQDTAMTYDGYGRPQSKHVPEQQADPNNGSSTDHATWIYNNDDTIHSVTDARGASSVYSYNNRRLLNGITFAAPSGITVPSAVAFDYDAVGNRRWMTDGSGRVDYVYDQLSRLQSETRQFVGLSATYTLAYEYTLSGELKKITEPSGSHADYSYDSMGRLSGVAGDGLGASQYASSMQYRAWGGLKSMTNGNSTTLGVNYNNRAQITHYSVGGVKAYANGPTQPEGGDFQYYNDGRTKFASDLRTDAVSGLHDRAYSYDHAARLQQAYSGAEARDLVNGTNSGVHDGTFRQTYNYDTRNNLTTRTGRFWSEDDNSTDSFNNQNRNPLWDYDADGRLNSTNDPAPDELTYQPLRFTYDASGHRVQSAQTTSKRAVFNNNVIFTTVTTQAESYDGDGELTKASFTTQTNTIATSINITFFLRSSLSGQVIAEYNSAGVRQNAYVYAGDQILVQQRRLSDTATQLMWQHLNPITGDGLNTDSQGNTLIRTTLDPMGVNLGDTNPFIGDNGGTNGGDGEGMSQSAIDAMVAGLIPGWGGIKCRLEGAITGCRFAFGFIGLSAEIVGGRTDTRPQNVVYGGQSTIAIFRVTSDGYQGYVPINASYRGQGNFFFTGTPLPHGYYRNHARIPDTDFTALNRTGDNELNLAHVSGAPQNADPASLTSHVDNVCSLLVEFTGAGFGQQNGSGISTRPGMKAGYGFGFTVSGTVVEGGIGRVEVPGNKPNSTAIDVVNSKGAWTIQQWVSYATVFSYDNWVDRWITGPTYDSRPTSADGPGSAYRRIEGNNFLYADFPGPYAENDGLKLKTYHGEWDFDVKLVNGNQQCEVQFHISMSLQNGNWQAHPR